MGGGGDRPGADFKRIARKKTFLQRNSMLYGLSFSIIFIVSPLDKA